MSSLAHFTLAEMTELGAMLRQMGERTTSIDEVAQRVVDAIRGELIDRETGQRECPLVRFFMTMPYEALDPELQSFARRLLGERETVRNEMRCLTLMATSGDRPCWNDRSLSVRHRTIPLASNEMVNGAPMIARLLDQLGVRVDAFLSEAPELIEKPAPDSFNVFFVPEAPGSDCIPDQNDFVEAFGIESVLGFGGMLPSEEIFVVILFSRAPITREVASLFRTLALNVKIALLGVSAEAPQREGLDAQ
jgi:hypothetical protein